MSAYVPTLDEFVRLLDLAMNELDSDAYMLANGYVWVADTRTWQGQDHGFVV